MLSQGYLKSLGHLVEMTSRTIVSRIPRRFWVSHVPSHLCRFCLPVELGAGLWQLKEAGEGGVGKPGQIDLSGIGSA